ncbi:hypothetical protein LCGC14_1686620 [marine sediment metagenome]|uniref:Uncharacterized protein n=1 Tax=marine sediment metagenome TaxID=412755 RepID=A0A0F9HM44_9ZZZZ
MVDVYCNQEDNCENYFYGQCRIIKLIIQTLVCKTFKGKEKN